MEDVLEVYQRPYDGNEVLVCMDETSKQQVKETRVPCPASARLIGHTTSNAMGEQPVHAVCVPLDGWRRVEVRDRTKVDWAHVIKKLVDEDYPDGPDRAGWTISTLKAVLAIRWHSSLLKAT